MKAATIVIATIAIVTASCTTGWNGDTEPTWVEYQACIETVALEDLNAHYFRPGAPADSTRNVRNNLARLSFMTMAAKADATEACQELRPTLITDD